MASEAEHWRPIPDWTGFYEASSLGRIRSVPRTIEASDGPRRFRGKILRPYVCPGNGYPMVVLTAPGRRYHATVHALVTAAFLGARPAGYEVCHGDGDKLNNAIENLRYDTQSSNTQDRLRHGFVALHGDKHPQAKLTTSDVRAIRRLGGCFTHRQIAALYGVSNRNICDILRGHAWKRTQ